MTMVREPREPGAPQGASDKGSDFFREEMVRAAPWSVATVLLRHGTNLVSVVLFARLLTPADFGVAAIVLSMVGLSVILIQMGLAQAFVAFENASQRTIDSLFWLSNALALAVYAVLALASEAIAEFYALPVLGYLLPIGLAAIVAQNAMGLIAAQLQRKLDYPTQTIMNSVGPISTLLMGLPIAAAGYGPLALVLPVVVGSMLAAIVGLMRGGLRPRIVFDARGAGPLLRLSYKLMLSNLAVHFSNSGVALVAGRYWSPHVLGLYNFSVANNLKVFEVLASPISPHLFQIFMKLGNDDATLRAKLFGYMRFAQTYLLPLYVLLFIGAPDIFSALFGERWLEAVPFFQAMLIVSIAKVMNSGTSTVVLARRQGALIMAISFVRLLGTAVLLALFLVLQWSPLWIVVTLALFDGCIYLAFIPMGLRLVGASATDYLRTIPVPIGLSMAVGFVFVLASSLLEAAAMKNSWTAAVLVGCCAALHLAVVMGFVYPGRLRTVLARFRAQRV